MEREEEQETKTQGGIMLLILTRSVEEQASRETFKEPPRHLTPYLARDECGRANVFMSDAALKAIGGRQMLRR